MTGDHRTTVAIETLTTRSGSATHTGLRRQTNEDSLLDAFPVFLVADGMGGHEAGEVASALAVEAFAAITGTRSASVADVRSAFTRAGRAIASLRTTGTRRAGTTVSGAAVVENEGEAYWLVFNLGDSRTYRVHGNDVEQISVDHSVVQELVDEGEIDAAAAASHPGRNVITRALGAGGDHRPDFWLMPIEPGDRILICSDGVSGELDPATIRRVLLEEAEPQAAAVRLVHEGMLHGGRDNLTAVVVDVVDIRQGAEQPTHDDEDTVPRPPVTAGGRA
ncbi:PP2C family protein-serine/threonine phosphatase [Cnuibacter sp. UC19_7]|uniref:PP2C family protein-serine/threonine phosphatase n=1 Tax=Cnuibacter sp. UC19_7 TaxID=3350166 RepID=UPI00366DC4F0